MGSSTDQSDALLREVSRSFYLSLRVLPPRLRPLLGCAYLLARASDTVADAPGLSPAERFDLLDAIEGDIAASTARSISAVRMVANKLRHPGERRLMLGWSEVLSRYARMSAGHKTLVQKVLATIIAGQRLDIEAFQPGSPSDQVRFLTDEQTLHKYTYSVAGSVGIFWSEAVELEYPRHCKVDWPQLREWGESYGRGLQLLNILRDFPADWRQGRCYLPAALLPSPPDEGWNRGHFPAEMLRPVIGPWLDVCDSYLQAADDYWQALRGWRLRLASQLPVAIAMPTLEQLRASDASTWQGGVKLPRRQVRRLFAKSLIKSIRSGK